MKAPLFGLGMQGKTPVITAKLLQCFYIEYRPQGEKTQVVAIGIPGLDLFADFGGSPTRGEPIEVQQNSLGYLVNTGTFWEINNAAVMTSRGTLLTTSGNVMMAHNGTVILVIDGTYGYVYTIATTTLAQIVDPQFPANPTSVTWQDGWFIVGFDDGTFYISPDGVAWDGLDFATAESDPDRLIRVVADHGELIMFGDISTEFWADSGAADFPYSKLKGANAEWGLAARWSAAKFDNSIAFLCKNRLGEVMVGRMQGHSVTPLSTPDLATIINAYATTSDATAFSYMLGQHPMYQINFPSVGASWLFDGLTNEWTKMKSYGMTGHRCAFGTQYLSRTVLTDAANGKLYKLNPLTYTENGETIEGEIIGEHWDSELQRFVIDKLRIDMEVGVGTTSGQGSDPQLMVQFSRDGGKSWGTEIWRSFGALGDYKKIVEILRCGLFRRATVKLRITDPVRRVIIGAYVNPKD